MERRNAILDVLSHPSAYRFWKGPFAERQIRPLLEHNDVTTFKKVLDVGCSPGTNAVHLGGPEYLGIDLNPKYIEYARKKFAGTFEVADATRFSPPLGARFDSILINSLLHHIGDSGVTSIMKHMRRFSSQRAGFIFLI